MNRALIMDEVKKLIRKQAISLVTPVAGQFLSQVFTVLKFSASGGESETSESFRHKMPFQDGRSWDVERPTAEERLVGLYSLKDAYLSIQIAERDRMVNQVGEILQFLQLLGFVIN